MNNEDNPFDLGITADSTDSTDSTDSADTADSTDTADTPDTHLSDEKTAEPGPKRKRRTKADKAPQAEKATPFTPVVLPVNARSGKVTGEIRHHNGRPVVVISKEHWVGEAPMTVPAAEIDDLLSVLNDLRAAASGE